MLPLPVIQPAPSLGGRRSRGGRLQGEPARVLHQRGRPLRPGDHVVVEAERGADLGRVKSVGGVAAKKCSSCGQARATRRSRAAHRRCVRRAEPEEVQRLVVLRADEERVRRKAREMVEQHGLKMKVTEAEWQWDRNKLTLYFTAERRVDFRQLVRDLARTFRTRIELKQIGVRDEAALLGGVGRCGRELCCSTWLREIKPISLQLAKDQNLSLNPAQISGTCGRLMCCLTYEHDAYLAAAQALPARGEADAHGAGAGEGDRHRHLARPGDAARREPPAPRRGAGGSQARDAGASQAAEAAAAERPPPRRRPPRSRPRRRRAAGRRSGRPRRRRRSGRRGGGGGGHGEGGAVAARSDPQPGEESISANEHDQPWPGPSGRCRPQEFTGQGLWVHWLRSFRARGTGSRIGGPAAARVEAHADAGERRRGWGSACAKSSLLSRPVIIARPFPSLECPGGRLERPPILPTGQRRSWQDPSGR